MGGFELRSEGLTMTASTTQVATYWSSQLHLTSSQLAMKSQEKSHLGKPSFFGFQ